MVNKIIPAIVIMFLLGSCSSLKQLGFSNNSGNKPVVTNTSPTTSQNLQQTNTPKEKFIENISTTPQALTTETSLKSTKESKASEPVTPKTVEQAPITSIADSSEKNSSSLSTENVSALQAKYAGLLNTDLESIQNLKLFEYIDDWVGTSYKLGGTTKDGIDCSAFVQELFAVVYGITLPRTAKYQYLATRRISTTQLKEGDLLFFHTRRNHHGVTHVGIYLQNNKFVQSSSSGGVKISDMYEPYYVQHLIATGRVNKKEMVADR